MSLADYRTSNKGERIDRRVRSTCSQLKQSELFLAALVFLTVAIGYFFAFVLLDHWLLKGGASSLFRIATFAAGVFLAVLFLLRRFVPLVRFSVNPLYAAKVLEEKRPSMKNSLINWLLLRRECEQRPELKNQTPFHSRVIDGIATQSLNNLDQVPEETVVDRKPLVRWGAALIALVGIFAVYALVSPKSAFHSFSRLALPFSSISAPTRVRFEEILPGNATVYQGETVTVTARIHGAGKRPVYLYYTSDDQRVVDQIVPMFVPEGGFCYECRFPPGKFGFEQGITYSIGVGEDRSRTYRFTVQAPMNLEVRELVYTYPQYTGEPPATVRNTGDIRALEGTKVEIRAKSNFSLSRAAFIPDDDENSGKSLTVSSDKTSAHLAIWLAPDFENPELSEFQSYVLRGYDDEGRINRTPSVYRVDLFKDQPPNVSWVDPPQQQLTIPLNGFTESLVSVEDADFGLRFVRMHFDVQGKTIAPLELLESPAQGPTKHTAAVNLAVKIQPDKLGLAAGDAVEYWVEAVDTRLPEGNTAVTERLSFLVAGPRPGADRNDANQERPQQNTDQEQQGQQEERNPEHQSEKRSENENGNENENEDGSGNEGGNENKGENRNENDETDSGERENVTDREKDGEDEADEPTRGAESETANDKGGEGDETKKREQEGENGDQSETSESQNGKNGENGKDDQNSEHGESGGGNGEKSAENGEAGEGEGNSASQGDASGGTGRSGGEGDASEQQGFVPDSPEHSENEGDVQGNETGDDSGGAGRTQDSTNRKSDNAASRGNRSQNGEPVDADAQPGEVFDRVLESMKEKGRETDPNRANTDQSPAARQHSDDLDPNTNRTSDEGIPPQAGPNHKREKRDGDKIQKAYEETQDNGTDQPLGKADPNRPIINSGENPQAKPAASQPSPLDREKTGKGSEGMPGEGNVGEGAGEMSGPSDEGPDSDRNSGDSSRENGSSDSPPSGPSQNGEGKSSADVSPDGRNAQEGNSPQSEQSGHESQSGQEGRSGKAGGESGSNSGSVASTQARNGGSSDDFSGTGRQSGGGGGAAAMAEDQPEGSSARMTEHEANLEFTKKQTGLALRYLEEELSKLQPDPELLNRLGWSRDELQAFVDNWNNMAKNAIEAKPGSREDREWKDHLRSIGTLRPGRDTRHRSRTHTEAALATGSSRTPTPSRFRSRVEAYNNGISRE